MDTTNPFVNWPGYDRLASALKTLRKVDYSPLFAEWLDVIWEDNRTGVLSGLDKDGAPMTPVTYRNIRPPARAPRFRTGDLTGKRVSRFKGRSGGTTDRFGRKRLPNNNLTTEEYKLHDGPPLAPRRERSRVITNLLKRTPRREGGAWVVACAWGDVLDPKGRPLLPRHFTGKGRLPARDLRGVRPQGRKLALLALQVFAEELTGKAFD